MSRKVAVIGCGNMGSAVVRGLLEAKWTDADSVTATNPHPDRLKALQRQLGIHTSNDNARAAKDADIILLGVKPQIIKYALKDLRGHVRPDQLVISIAAGISTRFIEYYTEGAPVVRSMPNLAATVGMGATALAPGTHAKPEHMALAREVFEAVGIVEEVHESLMDAVTGLSGTGPMYVFYLVEAMSDAGVKVGLPRDVATRLAMQTVRGSARLAQLSDLHPAQLKDQVSSPGGTSITALHVLQRAGFAATVMDAVEAATKRSAELGE
jgi:pyrroline-5-carboxylate reductase